MIDTLRLQNFRSYKDNSFEFDQAVNIVVGPNASGKTNLLEAIAVLAGGKSFRARDIELVRFGAPWARLDGFFGQQERTLKLVANDEQAAKEFVIDNQKIRRLSLERTYPVVLFEPGHLQLLTRGPETRRRYFDDILERTSLGFKSLAASYQRTLAQRNALLKQPPVSAQKQLFAWDVRLSELGGQIAAARWELVEQVNGSLSKIYNRISGRRHKTSLRYDAQFPAGSYSSKLLAKLNAGVRLDLQRGFTAYGPHREDFSLMMAERPASLSASRGETRSLVLALKIFELGLVEQARGIKPIFLLDDVFSELDAARRRHLVENLAGHQTIITTTDADAVMEYFAKRQNLITM